MPDVNKFKKLRDINYTIRACAVCIHGDFYHKQDWGTCSKHLYKHAKHTGDLRGVSIVRYGSCSDFVVEPSWNGLGAHAEFLDADA